MSAATSGVQRALSENRDIAALIRATRKSLARAIALSAPLRGLLLRRLLAGLLARRLRRLLRGCSRALLRRHLLAFAARLGQADGDRLFAALDLAARAAALQRPGLALLHRAPDFGRRALGVFACCSCHEDGLPVTSQQSRGAAKVPVGGNAGVS